MSDVRYSSMEQTVESPSSAVVRAVADHNGVDPVAVQPPLFDAIDPDALDSLFPGSGQSDGVATVSFEYAGCEVTVASDGDVTVTEL